MSNDRIEMTQEAFNEYKKDLKTKIELSEALQRLIKNPDFKKVFTEGYAKEEAVRIVHLRADHSIIYSDKRELHLEDINERLIGIARFTEYVRGLTNLGELAKQKYNELETADIEFVQ